MVLTLVLWTTACSSGPQRADAAVDLPGSDRGGETSRPDLTPQDQHPPRPDGKPNLGQACSADHHCSAGLVCDTSQPGGSCSKSCKDHAACGSSSSGCYQGWCRPLCNPRSIVSTCRADYACRIDGTRAFCVGSCVKLGCKPGWTCDSNSGLCVDPTAGKVGAACGLSVGTCEGTPNGICILLSTDHKAFCTVPCAPFTKGCPTQFPGAYCAAGKANHEYCVFLCDPKAPQKTPCPNSTMSCVSVAQDYSLCLPK